MPTGPFLIEKSVPGDIARDVIAKIQGASSMPGGTVRVPKLTTKIGKAANGQPVMIVYDAGGNVVGTIDPKALQPVQQPGDDKQKQQDANAARVAAQHAPPSPAEQAQTAAADVVKAMNEALAPVKPRPGLVAKALGGTPVTAAFGALLKELDGSRQDVLKAAVSAQSMRLMTGFGMPADQAITVCKREAVLAARRRGLI